MNKPSLGTENEKNKEIKEASEAESYENYQNEALENAEEGLEEDWLSENGVPNITGQSPRVVSDSECETWLESSLKNSYEERKELLLREKWFTVTGRKPRNIPIVRIATGENAEKFSYFGERKQIEVEKRRNDKIMIAAKKMEALNIRYGKVHREIRLQSLNRGVLCVKFSSNGNSLAFSERNGAVEVRSTSTNKLISRLKTTEQNESLPVRSLIFHPYDSEKLYTAGDCGVIQMHDVDSGTSLDTNDGFDTINVMDINADGHNIATGGRAGRLHVVDASTLQTIWSRGCSDLDGTKEPSVDDDYHRLRIYALKFHPVEVNLFATGGWDNVVKVWDVRVPGAIRSFCGPRICGNGLDIKDNIILTASWRAENSLSIWDFSSGELIKGIPIKNKSIKMEGEFLYMAQFFQNNHPNVNSSMIAVGGSGFPEMLIINVYTEKVEKYFPSYKAILALDIFQNLVVYGGKESVLRIAELTGPPSHFFNVSVWMYTEKMKVEGEKKKAFKQIIGGWID